MPIYEYYCGDCHIKFDALRPMSQADDPIICSRCQGTNTSRTLSLFAAISKSASGESRSIAGGSSCSTCAATTCASCVTNRSYTVCRSSKPVGLYRDQELR